MTQQEQTQTAAQTVAVYSLALDFACQRLIQACSPRGEVHGGADDLRQMLIGEAATSASRMSAVMGMVAEVAADGADGTGGGPTADEKE